MIFKLLEDHGRRYLCYFIPFPSLEEVILDSLADVMSIAEKHSALLHASLVNVISSPFYHQQFSSRINIVNRMLLRMRVPHALDA